MEWHLRRRTRTVRYKVQGTRGRRNGSGPRSRLDRLDDQGQGDVWVCESARSRCRTTAPPVCKTRPVENAGRFRIVRTRTANAGCTAEPSGRGRGGPWGRDIAAHAVGSRGNLTGIAPAALAASQPLEIRIRCDRPRRSTPPDPLERNAHIETLAKT